MADCGGVVAGLFMDFVKPRSKALAPGKEVDAWCGRCSMVLAHVIVAMDASNERILRVQCRSCQNTHAFRDKRFARKSTKPSRSNRSKESLTTNEYQQLMMHRDTVNAKTYASSKEFVVDDVVAHTAFGTGVVTKTLSDNKVEIAFSQGMKVLVHNRGRK